MKLPRDLSGEDLAQLLRQLGYQVTRQSGSHMRLTTQENGEHHITIPKHDALRIGTLNQILRDVAEHFIEVKVCFWKVSSRPFGFSETRKV